MYRKREEVLRLAMAPYTPLALTGLEEQLQAQLHGSGSARSE
jgi:hypothetical protein